MKIHKGKKWLIRILSFALIFTLALPLVGIKAKAAVTYHWEKFNCTSSTNYSWKKYNVDHYENERYYAGTADYYNIGAKQTFSVTEYLYNLGNSAAPTPTFDSTTGGYSITVGGSITTYTRNSKTTTDSNGYYTFLCGNYCTIIFKGKITGHSAEYTDRENDDWVDVYYDPSANGYFYWLGSVNGGGDFYQSVPKVTQSSLIGSVSSPNASQYPSEGLHTDGYYYVYTGSSVSYSMGSTTGETVTSTTSNAYPDNGRHKDGYWYVKTADTTGPSISSVSGASTVWAQSRTITINASDSGVGLNRGGAYSFDGGASWTASNSKTFSSTIGTATIKVRDDYDNVTTKTVNVYVDTTAPESISVSYDDTTWTQSKTITASASDLQSGINPSNGYGWSSDNSNWTWQGNTYTVTNPGIYYLKVRDNLENPSAVTSFTVTKVDNKAPAITNVTQSGWSTSSVTLTVTAQDLQANGAAGSGIAGYQFASGEWQTGNTWTTSQNGAVNIYVKDNTGRVSAVYPFTVSHIDTTAPSVSVTKVVGSTNADLDDAAWSNQKTTVTITATDTQSGPSAYSIDGGSTWTTWPTTRSSPDQSVTLTYDTNTETVLSIKVRDAVLNASDAQQVTVKVDKTIPSVSSVDQIPEPTYPWVTVDSVKWTGGNITLKVNATDAGGSGLADSAYSFDNGASWQESPEYTVDSNGRVTVKVLDDAGNIYTQNVRVTAIDKSIPQEPSFTWDSVNWTNTDKTVTIGTIIDDGGSGIGSVVVKYGETILTTRSSGSNVIFDAPQNGTYTVIITDNVGNTRTTSVTISKIDKEAPMARVDGNPTAWQGSDAHLTIVASDLPAGTNSELAASPYSWDNGDNWTNDPNLSVSQNQTLHVIVRDSVGNETPIEVNVEYVDEVKPEDFTIAGNPTEWTKDDVILTIPDARDTLSGLSDTPYNWNGTGYTSLNTYTVTENRNVSVTVSDAVGNTKTQSVSVTKIDKTAPGSVYITGNPTEWTKGPVTITAHATDTQSRIKEYSWDNGTTWQASPENLYYENQSVTLLVKDNVGNISAPYAFDITRVDNTPPALSVVMTAASADRKGVITQLYATDYGAPGQLLYAWDYDPVANTGTWGTIIQAVLKSGQDYTIACKDPVGNISYQTVKPKAYEMPNGGGNVPMFSQSTLDCAGYILGKTAYMDTNGTVSKYADTPLAVTVRAEPQYGGWMAGYAMIGSAKYPITWDTAGSTELTQEAATGTFTITPESFTATKKNVDLTVQLFEYEDETKATRINQDTLTATVSIDVTAPITSISLYADTITITSRDTLAGMESVQYRMQGTEAWTDYTAPFELPESGILEVKAQDKVGNESITASVYLTKTGGTSGGSASPLDEGTASAEYRSYWFNYYLIGSTKNESWRT